MPELRLPYPPSANRYWRIFNGRAVTSAEARDYKRQVALAVYHALGGTINVDSAAPVRLSVALHPVRPKRWKPGTIVRCIDLDNALKVALDSIQGIAYENDKQVVEIHARRGEPVEGGALVVAWETA